jgi:hypothetical protein
VYVDVNLSPVILRPFNLGLINRNGIYDNQSDINNNTQLNIAVGYACQPLILPPNSEFEHSSRGLADAGIVSRDLLIRKESAIFLHAQRKSRPV